MSLLSRRRVRPRAGRHHADSLTDQAVLPARKGPVALRGRHADLHQGSRLHIVRDSTGWAGLARMCADAAAHPVLDLRITCPALFRADADTALTQPFTPIGGDPR